MLPVNRNLTIYKGDSFELFFRLRERDVDGSPGDYIDLTGATPKAQIRQTEDATSTIAEFTATLSDQVTTPGGVYLTLDPAVTGAGTFGNGMWDVQITYPNGAVRTYLRGTVTVVKEITRV